MSNPLLAIFALGTLIFTAAAGATSVPTSLPGLSVNLTGDAAVLTDRVFSVISQQQFILEGLPVTTGRIDKLVINTDSQYHGPASEFDTETRNLIISAGDCEIPWSPTVLGLYDGVFIHEYGHAIFQANVERRLGPLLDPKVDKARGGDWTRFILNSQFEKANQVPVGMACMLAPFNELFADTMAVLMLNDPRAIAKFVSACQPTAANLSFQRDFSAAYPLKGWPDGTLSCRLMDDFHPDLNPSRSHIWEVLNGLLKNDPRAKTIVLRSVLNATLAVVQRLNPEGTLPREDWENQSLEDLNRMFIEEFDRAVASR